MKVEINEYDHSFDFAFTPETIAEAALLVRMGMNANKDVVYVSTTVSRDGTIDGSLVLRKTKRPKVQVGRGRW